MFKRLIVCLLVAASSVVILPSPVRAEPPCGAIDCPPGWPCDPGTVCMGDRPRPVCLKIPTATETMMICGPAFG